MPPSSERNVPQNGISIFRTFARLAFLVVVLSRERMES